VLVVLKWESAAHVGLDSRIHRAERKRREEERRLLRLVQVGSERDIAGLVRLELV
jgi:hypothetical protein